MGLRVGDPVWYRRVRRRWGEYGSVTVSWWPGTVVGRGRDDVSVEPRFSKTTFRLSTIDVRPRDPKAEGRDRPDRVASEP